MAAAKSSSLSPWLVVLLAALGWLLIRPKASAASVKKSYLGKSSIRGVRNNNPLNIRVSSNPWKGKIPMAQNSDGAFEQFTSWVWGVRAAIYNLRTHYKRGKNTLHSLIYTWCPPSDPGNAPGSVPAYVAHVSRATGIDPGAVFSWDKATVSKIVRAMAQVECAQDVVSVEDFNAAWALL